MRAQHGWAVAFEFSTVDTWVTVPAGTVQFESAGGPLMINVDMSLFSSVPQTFSCRPMIDGRWAGEYGNYPYAAKWTEGLAGTSYGWILWTKSRLYTGIPAGSHTLTVQCLKDATASSLIGHAIVPQSVSVLEMN